MEGFSLREAAALAMVSERVIRHERARGVTWMTVRRVGRANRLRLSADEVFYYFLLRKLPISLAPSDRRDLFRLVSLHHEKEGRWRTNRRRLTLSGGIDLEIKLASPRKLFRQRVELYRRGLRRVISRPDTLSGEPIFAGTRIPIRHIGELRKKRVPVAEILRDFPALTSEDVEFARLFTGVARGPGRPRRRLELQRAG